MRESRVPFDLVAERPWYLRARLVLLTFAWGVTLLGGLTLHVLSDVFQLSAPQFPVLPCVVGGVALNAACSVIAANIGSICIDGFRLYQPFVGGQSFVVMQAFGYGALCLCEVLVCIYYVDVLQDLHNLPKRDAHAVGDVPAVGYTRYGVLSILGALPFAANVVLLSSLSFFVAPMQTPTTSGLDRRTGKKSVSFSNASVNGVFYKWSKSPLRESAFVVAFCFVVVFFAIIGALVPKAARVSLVVVLGFHALNLVLIHVVIGWCHTPGYYIFMPKLRTWLASGAQFMLWLAQTLMLYWGVGELHAVATAPARLLTLAFGSVGMTVALLIFVRVFMPVHLTPENSLHRAAGSSRSMLSAYGPATMTFTSLLHAALLWVLATGMLPSWEASVVVAAPTEWTGVDVAELVACLFIMCFPMATHVMGRLVIGDAFEMWQPFRGSLSFIALQGLGWTAFSGSCVTLAAFVNTRERSSALLHAALSVFAQVMVHCSLLVFQPSDADGGRSSSFARFPNQMKKFVVAAAHQRGVSLVSTVLNGEMLVALLMSVVAMVLRVVCDVAVLQLKRAAAALDAAAVEVVIDEKTLYFIVVMTAVMGAASVPIAHLSGRDKGIAVFRPFGGSGAYVALQAVGWTLYSVALLLSLVSMLLQAASQYPRKGVPDSFQLVGTWQSIQDVPLCWFSVDMLFWALPLALITVSVFVETKQNWDKLPEEEASWDAQLQLTSLLQRVIQEDSDREAAFALLDTLVRPLERDSTPWSARSVVAAKAAKSPVQEEMQKRARLKEQQASATLIICMTAVGTAVLFVVAAVWYGRQPQKLSVAFAVAGLVLTTLACFATHYVFGTLVHGDVDYAFFMPFTGGASFIALQAVGWAFYTASTVLVLHAVVLNEASVATYLIAAIFSVGAQSLVLGSIPRFRAPQSGAERSVLERNAEALLAGLLFIASFSYSYAHRALASGEELDDSPSNPTSPLIPMVVSGVTSCFAIPLTVLALRRSLMVGSDGRVKKSTRGRRRSQNDERLSTSAMPSDQERPEAVSVHMAQRLAQLLGLVAAMLLALLPLIVVFLVHFIAYGSLTWAWGATDVWHGITAAIGCSLLTMSLFDGVTQPGTILSRVSVTLPTLLVFSLPTIVVVVPCSMPFIVPGSLAAQLFPLHCIVLMLLGDVAAVRFMCSVAEVCVLGLSLSKHLLSIATTPLPLLVADATLPIFMIYYHKRYVGSPERRGTLAGGSAVAWAQKFMLENAAQYFKLRVVVERREGPQVGHKDCWVHNPVIFSFHPHGVFPGTTLLLPHTTVWQNAVRIPTDSSTGLQKLSVHAAGVVFRVAFLRDVVMALSGRVVSRPALVSSLQQGNSVMIVTGGQAEMLHSRCSTNEMHLVTHHVGFLRLAVQQQVPVVPLLCFAENNVMSNINLPWLQRKTLKWIGFPFPTVPIGRWFLPLPNRTPLTVVVGRPLNPPDGLNDTDEDGLRRFAAAYFESLKDLFYKYRADAGYPQMELVLHDRNHSHNSRHTSSTPKL